MGRLATADAGGQPMVVPICYAFDGTALYSAVDAKPKQAPPEGLKRIRYTTSHPNDTREGLIVAHRTEGNQRRYPRSTLRRAASPTTGVIRKALTGIQGFDEITDGGLPRGRTTLVMGGPGCGKTVFALQALFNVGMGLSMARVGAGADDFSQLLPFLVRTWLYFSGVMFSIQTIGSLRHHPTITYLLQVNPAAVYIGLVRNAILQSQRTGWPGSKPYNAANCALYHTGKKAYLEYSAYCHGTVSMNGLWLWGIGWAIVALVVGFVFFWQAETRYGRG